LYPACAAYPVLLGCIAQTSLGDRCKWRSTALSYMGRSVLNCSPTLTGMSKGILGALCSHIHVMCVILWKQKTSVLIRNNQWSYCFVFWTVDRMITVLERIKFCNDHWMENVKMGQTYISYVAAVKQRMDHRVKRVRSPEHDGIRSRQQWAVLNSFCGDVLEWPIPRCLPDEGPKVRIGLAFSLSLVDNPDPSQPLS
jgi:hypothetical protein